MRPETCDLKLPLCFDRSSDMLLSKPKGSPLVSESARIELPQGTLDLLILKAIALEPQHGWAIPNASIRFPATS